MARKFTAPGFSRAKSNPAARALMDLAGTFRPRSHAKRKGKASYRRRPRNARGGE